MTSFLVNYKQKLVSNFLGHPMDWFFRNIRNRHQEPWLELRNILE